MVFAFRVAGIFREGVVGRAAVVELGVPNVLVINQQDAEMAMRNVRDGAATIGNLASLNTVFRIEIRGVVLQHKHHHGMTGLVVQCQCLAVIGTDIGRERYKTEAQGQRKQYEFEFHVFPHQVGLV